MVQGWMPFTSSCSTTYMKPIKFYEIGAKIRILVDIWEEDSDNAFPAYYIAKRGDIGVVTKPGQNPVVQLMTGTKALMRVHFDEIGDE
jgi:hypothetical protein